LAAEPRRFVYKPDILEELWRYGAHPRAHTPPDLVHEFVSDLYRYEISRLRERLLQREFPKKEYAGRVIELRSRYRIISMRPHEWVDGL
jgi:hypothetical protein